MRDWNNWVNIAQIIIDELIDYYFPKMKGKINKGFYLTTKQNNWMNDNKWKQIINKWSQTYVNTWHPVQRFFKYYKLRMLLIRPPEDIL